LESGRVSIPDTFEVLGENYCSLGQDANYYETLCGLPENTGEEILRALRDCVADPIIYAAFREEEGFQTSLLRSVSEQSITTTFATALGGQAPLTPFHFQYTFPGRIEGTAPPQLTFAIDPQAMPPTNVHAVIGRNGVGKTRLLNNIANSICQPRRTALDPTFGTVHFLVEDQASGGDTRFANLVTVTFSAFDPFRSPPFDAVTSGDIRFSNRPFGVKRFQTIHHCGVDVAHGLVLLFGIGTKALVWGFFSQEVFYAERHIIGFFVRSESPFIRPHGQATP